MFKLALQHEHRIPNSVQIQIYLLGISCQTKVHSVYYAEEWKLLQIGRSLF